MKPDPIKVLSEKHSEMGGIARLQDKRTTYFRPKLIRPCIVAATKIAPEPMKVVYETQRKMAGRESL